MARTKKERVVIDRKFRGKPLAELDENEIEQAIDYCLGLAGALFQERQQRLNPPKEDETSG